MSKLVNMRFPKIIRNATQLMPQAYDEFRLKRKGKGGLIWQLMVYMTATLIGQHVSFRHMN